MTIFHYIEGVSHTFGCMCGNDFLDLATSLKLRMFTVSVQVRVCWFISVSVFQGAIAISFYWLQSNKHI